MLESSLVSARSSPRKGVATPKLPAAHPGWLRMCHWINVVAVGLMLTSGWRIYNASPLFAFKFPRGATIGGWLGGALQWHFAGMWILVLNGLFYVALSLISGRFRDRFIPLTPRMIWSDLVKALSGRLSHSDPRHYNGVQRFAYVFAVADLALLVASGLVIWKPVQFSLLRDLMGGYDAGRLVHFCAMSALAAFIVVHLVMVILTPRTLVAMIRGR
jgi:thiosulfate reductase cytochrome b subunit